ncbi:hypothetical protein [Haloarcula onubensis]|uniref:Uncharacterized protein n=1 Tax=Haloarcula onubensis TaxID=2950539 RepID=A0ABU2FLB3_9EURY|nr:hypothetical protein [Halomicroarcula sp. S3CR25-11]MDS0281538.1 hypothetical protein [Halomicroarcula sp. S3CR25-11]
MSSYEPPENSDEESGHEPGPSGKEVVDSRQFSDVVGGWDRTDFILFAGVLGLPAGLLTVLIVVYLFPGLQDTAGVFVRWLLETVF